MGVIKLGTFDSLAKPFNIDELSLAIVRAAQVADLELVADNSSWRNRQEDLRWPQLAKINA